MHASVAAVHSDHWEKNGLRIYNTNSAYIHVQFQKMIIVLIE